jgi:hypothetical protein
MVMKKVVLVIVVATLVGCSSGISGEYSGKDCPYDKISFKSNGLAIVTNMGGEASIPYSVDGNKVSLGGGALVFTKKGDTLDAGGMGKCKRL